MSYCRWSSDNYGCDIYAYGDVSGGYTIHVATNRVVGDVPKVDMASTSTVEFMKAHEAQMEFLRHAKHEPLGLPYDGESYNEPTLKAFRERLVTLREAGYRFPDDVFERIDEEMREEDNG